MKTCTKCKIEKLEVEFCKERSAKDGLQTKCKRCDKIYREQNIERIDTYKKNYYKNNKEKIAESHRIYDKKNKESVNAYRKEYYKKNKEKMDESSRVYRENNRDRAAEMEKKWRDSNVEAVRESKRLYKIRKRATERDTLIKVTKEEINKLIKDSNNICFWCDEDISKGEMHLDHIYPLSKCGGHTISNLCVSCANCNIRKNLCTYRFKTHGRSSFRFIHC